MIEKAAKSGLAARAVPIIAAMLVAVAGGWALVRHGPRPASSQAVPDAGRSVVSPQAESSPAPALIDDSLIGMLGLSSSIVASGRASEPPATYLDALETLYKQRGFQQLDSVGPRSTKGRSPETTSVYWRCAAGGRPMLTALGKNANPHNSALDAQRRVYSTLVVGTDNGETAWTTCRYEPVPITQPLSPDSDWPGVDQAGVPRHPSLRRRLSFGSQNGGHGVTIYTSTETSGALLDWYIREMSRDWQSDSLSSAQSQEVLKGAICFTQGTRRCMIWIDPNAPQATTSVIISLRRQ